MWHEKQQPLSKRQRACKIITADNERYSYKQYQCRAFFVAAFRMSTFQYLWRLSTWG